MTTIVQLQFLKTYSRKYPVFCNKRTITVISITICSGGNVSAHVLFNECYYTKQQKRQSNMKHNGGTVIDSVLTAIVSSYSSGLISDSVQVIDGLSYDSYIIWLHHIDWLLLIRLWRGLLKLFTIQRFLLLILHAGILNNAAVNSFFTK